ncbi:RNA polymerase sigma factor RpoH [Amphibiibacter pelophylacis]
MNALTLESSALNATRALVPGMQRAVARDPWAALPSLGNLQAYIQAVQHMPLLSPEEERSLGQDLRATGNVQAAGKLVLSHLRLVVSISRQYLGYGLPQGDLIQEGNVGLMKAVKRFDPERQVRLVTYAIHWIKAEIHDFILRNWRIVKLATTKAQRKLFFNLRSMKHDLAADAEAPSSTLTSEQVDFVARDLGVKPDEVREMQMRMGGADVALEASADDSEETAARAPLHFLGDARSEPTRQLEARQREHLGSDLLPAALSRLDERSQRIVQARWLQEHDSGETGGATLHELAAELGISAERVRQIEAAAFKKLRLALADQAA